jgi:hypothetical protein
MEEIVPSTKMGTQTSLFVFEVQKNVCKEIVVTKQYYVETPNSFLHPSSRSTYFYVDIISEQRK